MLYLFFIVVKSIGKYKILRFKMRYTLKKVVYFEVYVFLMMDFIKRILFSTQGE